MKICTQCKSEKPVTDFYVRNASKSGLSGICKNCNNSRCKNVRDKNQAAFVEGGSVFPDEKTCTKCNETLPVSQYCKHSGSKDGLKNWCRSCNSESNKARDATLEGALRKLMNNGREHIRVKNEKGATKKKDTWIPLQHTITIEFLLELWDIQGGKCALSHINMSVSPRSNWHVSLERLDNSIGYVLGNVCLVCLEFNTAKQWRQEHIDYIWNKSRNHDKQPVLQVDENLTKRFRRMFADACKNAAKKLEKEETWEQ